MQKIYKRVFLNARLNITNILHAGNCNDFLILLLFPELKYWAVFGQFLSNICTSLHKLSSLKLGIFTKETLT